MLHVLIPGMEYYDERKNLFVEIKPTKLQLEHSLLSIAKWESKWHKPFYDPSQEKTEEEQRDYLRCMTITQNVDSSVYYSIPSSVQKQIEDYMNDSMTATWFREDKKSRNREIITAEIIYWWMFSQGIPLECQKWHINRLLTLIRVCSEKNREMSNPKNGKNRKMSKNSISNRKSLNQRRKDRLNSKG